MGMKIELEIDCEDVDKIVVRDLKNSYNLIDKELEPELKKSLLKVIEYYMYSEEFKEEFGD